MIERNKVVSNGCSGSCCESFTLPFDIQDFVANDKALLNGESMFTDTFGRERYVISDNTRDAVVDMLIPLGHTSVDPQYRLDPNHLQDKWGHFSDDDLFYHSRGFMFRKDGKVMCRTFTCRHFDKENRICGNYENRPGMCKSFGVRCAYVGCGYNRKYSEYSEQKTKELQDGNI